MNVVKKLGLLIGAGLVALTTSADTFNLPVKEIDGKQFYIYKVEKKNTVYGLTRQFNISREDLMKYNPQLVDGLRADDTLYIPVATANATDPATDPAPVTAPVRTPAPAPVPAPAPEPKPAPAINNNNDDEEKADTLQLAVVLPFMLEQTAVTRDMDKQLNFYRGLILGLQGSKSAPVSLVAYDTEGSVAKVDSLIGAGAFAGMDFIVAPGDSLSLQSLVQYADTTDAQVVNFFAVKNPLHNNHSSMIQANIPHQQMYARAIEAFAKSARKEKVIFLNATDIPADKNSFTTALRNRLIAEGVPYEQIDFEGKLTAEQLAPFADERAYAFIPTASSREALMRILAPLCELQGTKATGSMRLLGYPEWVIIRGDLRQQLHQLNTSVYSRFNINLDTPKAKIMSTLYEKTYGVPLDTSMPNTSLMGYDLAGWLLSVAANELETPFEGLQNAFHILPVDNGGAVNAALYIINFTPGNGLSSIVL